MFKKGMAGLLALAFVVLAAATLFFPAVTLKGAESNFMDGLKEGVANIQNQAPEIAKEAGVNGLNLGTAKSTSKSGVSMIDLRNTLNDMKDLDKADEIINGNSSWIISSVGLDKVQTMVKVLKVLKIVLNVCFIVSLLALAVSVICALFGVGNAGSPTCFMMFIWLIISVAIVLALNNTDTIKTLNQLQSYGASIGTNIEETKFTVTMWPIIGAALGVFATIFGRERRG